MRKVLNKRESQGKEDRVHPQAQILRKLKGKEGGKKAPGEKEKESHLPHHQMFQVVTSQQTQIQRLQLLIKGSRNIKRGEVQMEPPLQYDRVWQ